MKLIYSIAIRLSLILLPIMALWAVLFYFAIEQQIIDEVDDALDDYSEQIIVDMLAGQELPRSGDGTNNTYSIVQVDSLYATTHPHISYYDADIYIPAKKETEPARIVCSIFQDKSGAYYELKVSTPSFERDDMIATILYWLIIIYVVAIVTVMSITLWIFHNNMRPLYNLLHWLDNYSPGKHSAPVPNDTNIREFCRLNKAAQEAVDRSEQQIERQKQFVGNASHELQTPLAILSNRLEWLTDHTQLDEEQMQEVMKMRHTLNRITRLNKTLLLLTKIENGQYPESRRIDIIGIIHEHKDTYIDIYPNLTERLQIDCPPKYEIEMNDTLASILINNLMKNAIVHSDAEAIIKIIVANNKLTIANSGQSPLDKVHIFDRFYKKSDREGSTGLGLALVSAICRYYTIDIDYEYSDGMHRFSINWDKIRSSMHKEER